MRSPSATRWCAVVLAVLLVSGCGATPAGDAGEDTPLRIGYLHTIAVDDKLQYGLAEGIWEDEGLDVEAIEFDTGIAVSQALADGEIDVAIMGGVTSHYPAHGQGTVFLVNAIETATARLLVQKDSGIDRVADLAGRRLATTEATTADVFLHAALARAGVARSAVQVVNAPMPDAVQAFVAGSVDAVALWVPFDLRVRRARIGAVEIDHAGNYPRARVADGWVANNAWFEANRETAKALVGAWLEVNEAYRADPDAALRTVHEYAYDGQATLDDLRHQVEFQEDYTNAEWLELYRNGELLDVVGTAERAFVELGALETWVDPTRFFDTSLFVEVAGAQTRS